MNALHWASTLAYIFGFIVLKGALTLSVHNSTSYYAEVRALTLICDESGDAFAGQSAVLYREGGFRLIELC